jgi:hypothetical protein
MIATFRRSDLVLALIEKHLIARGGKIILENEKESDFENTLATSINRKNIIYEKILMKFGFIIENYGTYTYYIVYIL